MFIFPLIDYEMSTLSDTSERDKFTSVVHPEPERETSKVSLYEGGKAMEIISNSDNMKATQTDITMESIIWGSLEGPYNPEKGINLWDLWLENMIVNIQKIFRFAIISMILS